jgi:hypothetical protein
VLQYLLALGRPSSTVQGQYLSLHARTMSSVSASRSLFCYGCKCSNELLKASYLPTFWLLQLPLLRSEHQHSSNTATTNGTAATAAARICNMGKPLQACQANFPLSTAASASQAGHQGWACVQSFSHGADFQACTHLRSDRVPRREA